MRILIADDHEVVLEGLKVLLQRLGSEVTVVACGDLAGALEVAAKGDQFDLVILDLHMPGMHGVIGVEGFRAHFPGPPLVVISGHYGREEVLKALRLGAAGFLPKSLKAEPMVNALRLVLSGERFIPAELLTSGDPAADATDVYAGNGAGGSLGLLTWREAEVLEQLLKGLSNIEIGLALHIREITVKLHLRSIYRKLGIKNRTQAVMVALDAGWHQYKREPLNKREPLTADEATELANSCETHEEKLVVWTLLDSGLRVNELARLVRKNIDLQAHRLMIYGKGGPHGSKMKRRVIPLSTRIRPLIEGHFSINETLGMTDRTIQRLVKRVADRARISRPLSPHVLRHTKW